MRNILALAILASTLTILPPLNSQAQEAGGATQHKIGETVEEPFGPSLPLVEGTSFAVSGNRLRIEFDIPLFTGGKLVAIRECLNGTWIQTATKLVQSKGRTKKWFEVRNYLCERPRIS